ncbi:MULTISPECIES: DUF2076 domain-containing protein [Acidobacterium]|uniref:Periplasmic ligand-binding sensor protein n=1 Tax=Acidobacterium capsulatum (strain ATCC 51196 / DSM 11244 / BCRC 80197 / JCM 7670 / NBRC 15755 / NCIMB 13165 / 161) TaxID=240015 RepID=C1F135_ACIC5|nr:MULTISPECIES: DUF2076 domain-containing protein [Acidobacterium]ACO33452.1 conserved hypothetical protein [Acidobacterium capsulatum ATCC 51196]HCT61932.1 DUF2076 domain-containing protein [Acidobacterium sp.]
MTQQEAQMLQQLVQQVEATQLNEKDPAAEALLKDTLGRDPDALYKLAQTVLVQDIALHQAQARIRDLIAQQQAPVSGTPQPARSSSFLGGVLPQQPAAVPSSGTPAYQPVNAPPPAPYPSQYGYQNPYPAQPSYVAPPSAGSSFLRSAATTAAGVAAGALAFEGIESIFHHGMGFGSPFGFGGGAPVEETVINNNYYDDPNAGGFAGQDMQPQGAFDGGTGSGLDTGFDQGFDGGSFDDGGFDNNDDLL